MWKTSVLIVSGFLFIHVYSYDVLTDVFFENLRSHPFLDQKHLTKVSKAFIDTQIKNYVILATGVASTGKKKRSLLENVVKNDKGTYLLSEIKPFATIPVKFPEDLLIFEQNSKWFSAALESTQVKEKANNLVIFSYENENFTEIARVPVTNGVKLAAIDLENSTILAVAEFDPPKTQFHNKSAIYQFDGSRITKIQSLDMHYAKDVVFWRIHEEIHMALAQNTEVVIYKWLGKHFDLVQTLATENIGKITPFGIDSSNFLAVVNFNEGKKVHSEIYKYDFHSERYDLYQRILTKACRDLQVFTLGEKETKDTFLVVANAYRSDSEDQKTDSIIYKFIDGYFIPFQSIKVSSIQQFLPVQLKTGFALFAFSLTEGLTSFQYDGWSFRESTLKVPPISGKLRFTDFGNKSLVVADKRSTGKIDNVFHLEFSFERNLLEIYQEMMSWCEGGLKEVEDLAQNEVFGVVGKAQRADIEEDNKIEENKEIETRIDSLAPVLEKLNMKTPREIDADEIVFNSIAFISDLNTTTINGVPTDNILENVIDITSPFDLQEAQISSISADNSIFIKTINGHNPETLVHSTVNLTLSSLSIQGTLTVPEGVKIDSQLNGIVVSPKNLLLRDGEQKFEHPLKIKTIKADNLWGQSLNQNLATQPIKHLDTLTVKNLTVGGYINDVDIPTLEKHSLRKSGDQVITGKFTFDSIQGHNLEIPGKINNRKLSDLISIDCGNFTIHQTMIFRSDIYVEDLTVLNYLNAINVTNGKLNVLLKNHTDEQEITGAKIFDDVTIYHGIFLQGHINSQNLDKMKPVITINQNVFLEGDKKITGDFEVEGVVTMQDVVTSGAVYSLARLEKEGLRLDAKEIRPHLDFAQQLNVEEIFVETINNRSPDNFVVLGSEEPQIIQGVKTFLGDLSITGTTGAQRINNVDVEELENKVLKIEGDQVIEGKHYVRNLTASSLTSNETMFGANIKKDFDDVTVDKDLKGDIVKATEIVVQGEINGFNFNNIIDDTVTKGTNKGIGGHKYFKNITIISVDAKNQVVDEIPSRITELTLQEPVNIKNINISNLYFDGECNGLSRDQFGDQNLENGTVNGDFEFGTVVVLGDGFITSNRFNDVTITELAENSVKIDEIHEFESGIFESDVLVRGTVHLGGHIENFDFDNVVLETETESLIFSEKTFENVTVNGSIDFKAPMNGFSMNEFCRFTMGEMETKNLTIDGNAFFAKGPRLAHINGANVKKIKDKAWFSDRDTNITGSADFDDVIFRSDIEVQGFVDNISLSLLSENYFSKTKDQEIPATFTFENDLTFENELTVPNISLNRGKVNGVDLELFVRTALLDDYDQLFESIVFLDTCFVENITGDFTVNSLKLAQDVMRYDKVNMVTGSKIFENLNVEALKLDKNINIQNVDVLNWFKHAVLKTTGFNITGAKNFRNAVFQNGLYLDGVFNGLKFDANHVMLKDTPQDVTGGKTITTKPPTPVLFKGLKLKKRLNNIDVLDLVNNQAHKNQDNVFKTSLVLYNNITTNNLVIKKMYQGVNMTDLMAKVSNLGVLNNLLEQYERLLDMSYKLQKSIEDQAYALHHYKIVQTIYGVTNSRKILFPNGITKIGTLVSDGTTAKMDLYGWYQENQQMSLNATIRFPRHPNYIDQVMMGRYLYTEFNDGFGNFNRMTKSMDKEPSVVMATNKTISTTSFLIPKTKEACTLFIYRYSPPRVFCEIENKIEFRHTLPVKAQKASSITIKDTLYLIIITQQTLGAEPHTDVWCLDATRFRLHQSLFDAHPQNITTTFYRGFYYLAIASGHVQNAMYSGRVEIRRFDELTLEFVPWQSLELEAPIQVEFVTLPSGELILYVLTDSPTEPLLVFRYEGVGGFQLKITGSALPQMSHVNQFMGAAQHFLVAQGYDEINVIQAVFKGEKVD